VDARDNDGETPLHTVVLSNGSGSSKKEMAQLLIDNKADVDAKDKSGETPLHKAASASGRFDVKELVQLLLDNGADKEARSKYGYTPLREAKGEVRELLTRHSE
jgi:ankyrin repeat protein